MKSIARTGYWTASLIALCAALTGCGKGGPDRPAVFPAKGQITIDGKPATTGRLTLTPVKPDPKQPGAIGKVGSDGTFQLSTFADADGAAEGEFDATLRPDATTMSAVPAVKPVRITVRKDGSGKVSDLTVAFESAKKAAAGGSAAILAPGGTASARPPGR